MINHDNAIEICHKFLPDFHQTPLKIKLCKVQIYNKNSWIVPVIEVTNDFSTVLRTRISVGSHSLHTSINDD